MGQEVSPENWVETKAKITKIHNSIKRRATRAFADVSYRTKEGKSYQSRVEVFAIPYIGSIKSKNDSISLFYNLVTPQITKSSEISFLNSYGIYLLIFIGVLISLYNFIKLRKGNKED